MDLQSTDYQNPYAPQGLNGLNDPYPNGYVDRPAYYPQTITFSADGLFLNQAIPVDTMADFILRGIVVSQASGFTIRLLDASGTYLSNAALLAEVLSTQIATSWPIWPEVPFPAGSRIAADYFINTGVSPVTLQVVYLGVNRFRLPATT